MALLLTDVINDLDFDQADGLAGAGPPDGEEDRHPPQLQIPTVYLNDNAGQYKSDFRLMRFC